MRHQGRRFTFDQYRAYFVQNGHCYETKMPARLADEVVDLTDEQVLAATHSDLMCRRCSPAAKQRKG